MPIKKRKSLPPPQLANDPYKLPGRPLEELLREFDRKASDAAWEGDYAESRRLQSIADEYRARIKAGELYEVAF